MFNRRVNEWNKLRNHPVPERVLERGRIRLMAAMVSNPMVRAAQRFGWFANALVWKPITAVFVFAMSMLGAGGAVYASGSSLPGERLYKVKLLSEEVRARLALSPSERFRLRAEQATIRLSEAEKIMNDIAQSDDDREERIRQAMERYQNHLMTLNDLTVDMQNTPNDPEEGRKTARAVVAARAVERMVEKHDRLADSASSTKDRKARESFVRPMKHALELESRVIDALAQETVIESRMKAKAEQLRQRWDNFEHKKEDEHHDDEHEGSHDHDHTEEEEPTAPLAPDIIIKNPTLGGNARAEAEININTTDEAVRP